MTMQKADYIERLIAEGEHEHQDFKYRISDSRKIARTLSAFANNSGGHLLVGVKDNGHITGVTSEEEMFMIEQAATMYCHPKQQVQLKLFHVAGKTVLKVDIAESAAKPVKAPDEHGLWKAYYRVADENVLASNLHVKMLKRQAGVNAANSVIRFEENERLLMSYLDSHGGITVTGYTKLAHVSRKVAENSILNLLEMRMVTLRYHNGQCLIVKD